MTINNYNTPMDPITHSLTGIGLAYTGFKQKLGRGAVWALLIASNFPDLDIFGRYFINDHSWTYRRHLTHSIIGIPLLSLFGAIIFRLIYKKISFKQFFGMFVLAMSIHVFMDVINSYGVAFLFPFSRFRYELAWVFIIDLCMWGILLLCVLVPFIKTKWTERLFFSKLAMIIFFGYIGLCGFGREFSHFLLKNNRQVLGRNLDLTYVFPEPLGPHRFRGIVKEGNKYDVYLIHPYLGQVSYKYNHLSDENDPDVALIRQTDRGKLYEWFFKAPVWKRIDSQTAEVFDLRFRSLVLKRGAPFTYKVSK